MTGAVKLPRAPVIRLCDHPVAILVTMLCEIPDVLYCAGCGSWWCTPRWPERYGLVP